MDNQDPDLSYYLDVVRRRMWFFIIPMVLTFAVAVAVAVVLPPVYTSQATVLIEAQNIPEELVRTTVTGYVEERLQTLSQIVLSRQNLLEIIGRFNPYPDLMGKATTGEIVARMRADITMQPIHAQVGGARGRPSTATVAFKVSYQGLQPQTTAQVANALVTLYLEQNLRVREEKALATVQFFQQNLEDLRAEIDAKEAAMAQFKGANLHSLPELMQLNLQNLERIRAEINARRQDIQTIMERRIYLKGQLATIEPVRPAGGRRSATIEEELALLQNEHLAQSAIKSENHPDVVRLRNQIRGLEKETTSRQTYRDQKALLDDKQARLLSLRQRYSDNHPDVKLLLREIAVLEEEVDQLAATQSSRPAAPVELAPDNPAYISLQTQIASADFEVQSLKVKLVELENTYQEYLRRIENAPAVEQQMHALNRDYANAQARYRDTLAKLSSAREAMELEEGQMAEKLTVVEPPQVPENPTKPNRKAIVLLGFVLASGFGVGTAAIAEFMDQSVRRANSLARVSQKPILAVIPRLKTRRDKRIYWTIRIMAVVLCLALIAGTLFAVHNYYQPLDIIWLRILDRF